MKISKLKWDKKIIYNADELETVLKKLDIYNKKIIDIKGYEKPEWHEYKTYFVDLYNNIQIQNIKERKKEITITDIPEDTQRGRCITCLVFVIKFEDASTLELASDGISKIYIGYNGLEESNLKEYENANLIFKKILETKILDFEVKKIKTNDQEIKYISKYSKQPFKCIILKLNNNMEIYYSSTTIMLFNSDTQQADIMSFKEYKKAIYNVEQYFCINNKEQQ